ncbi:protein outspread isoform X2 [Plutella xylostella]|uniref:protein outspread isoform X2 n=1 Tax=Plutella xylostella TaxID=51655 RepID=UPI00203290AB|nr:protein outspread isoform X2 [Plutella xylostella]
MSGRSDCRKFAPNIFNKSKCTNCFRQKEEHSAEALESNRASRKISKCGYLFVAPGWDFSNPLYRTKRWQRRWFVLYDDGELTYSLDEHPDTVPQASIDMTQVLEVSEADGVTGHAHSLAVTGPERVTFVKGTCREEARWWADVLSVYPRSKGRHKRNATFPGGQTASLLSSSTARKYSADACTLRDAADGPRRYGTTTWPGPRVQPPQPEIPTLSAPPPIDTKVYTDQPVSSASPPTRDKINGEEKARSRRRDTWAEPSTPSNDDASVRSPLLQQQHQQYDEQLRDIAASLTRPRSRRALPPALERPTRLPPPDRLPPRGTPDGGVPPEEGSSSSASEGSEPADIAENQEPNEGGRVELPAERLLHARAGWLQRRGPGGWSRHWFVLRGAALLYFRDPHAEHRGLMDGVIDLSGVARVVELPTSASTNGYAFETETWDGKHIVLSAVTAGIRANWVSAIRRTAGLPDTAPLSLILREDNIDQASESSTSPVTPVTPITSRSAPFSSDEEYRTASEGGRRDSADWGDVAPQPPPSPILSRTPISKVKEKVRARGCHQIPPRSDTPKGDKDEIDATKEKERPTEDVDENEKQSEPRKRSYISTIDKQYIEIEDLRKQLQQALTEVTAAESELARLRKLKSEAALREKKMEELVITLQKKEEELSLRTKEAENIDAIKQMYNQDKTLWENKLTETQNFLKESTEHCEHLTRQLTTAQETVKQLQRELNELNDKLMKSVQENDNLYSRIRELESRIVAESPSKEKRKSIGSLSDLSNLNNDLEFESLDKDQLIEEYCELRNRFLMAIQEIKCMKKELRESNNMYDELEVTNLKLRNEMKLREQCSRSEIDLMAARILDLTQKLTASDKQVRTLKHKIQKTESREKRRSLSLKGRESFSLGKEVEEKLTELESKISMLEAGDPAPTINAPSSKSSSPAKEKVTKSDSTSEEKRMKRLAARLRRKSLDSATSAEPMKMLVRLTSLETKVASALGQRRDLAASCEALAPAPAAPAPPAPAPCGTAAQRHLLDRLQSLEAVVIHSREKVNECLCQMSAVRAAKSRRSPSPLDKKYSLKSMEKCLADVSRRLQECFDKCVVEGEGEGGGGDSGSGGEGEGGADDAVTQVVEQLEAQLRGKLLDVSRRKAALLDAGELTPRRELELLAEKLAYEAVLVARIQEALDSSSGSRFFASLIKSEIQETSQLIDNLHCKINGECGRAGATSRSSLEHLARILARKIDVGGGAAGAGEARAGGLALRAGELDALRAAQRAAAAAVERFKTDTLGELAAALAGEAPPRAVPAECGARVRQAWAAARDALGAELVRAEVARALARAAALGERSLDAARRARLTLTAQARADLELWWRAAHDHLRCELEAAARDAAARVPPAAPGPAPAPARPSRELLQRLADVLAHKALVDARVAVLEGSYRAAPAPPGPPAPADALSSLDSDPAAEAEFVYLFQHFSTECRALFSSDCSGNSEDSMKMGAGLARAEAAVAALERALHARAGAPEPGPGGAAPGAGSIFDRVEALRARVEALLPLAPCAACRQLQEQLERLQGERARGESAAAQQAAALAAARRARAQLTAQHERERAQLRDRARRLERRLAALDSEYSAQLDSLRAAYQSAAPDAHGDGLRARYQQEIEQLRGLCEKGLLAMESSHRRIVREMEEKHRAEREQLRLDKEQALAEETRATLAALDAMRKAHESEVRREVDKFKAEFLSRGASAPDLSQLSTRHQQEMEEIKREILSLSEKYSIKCVESAALEERLQGATTQLAHAQHRIMQLDCRNKQLRAHLISEANDMKSCEPSTLSQLIEENGPHGRAEAPLWQHLRQLAAAWQRDENVEGEVPLESPIGGPEAGARQHPVCQDGNHQKPAVVPRTELKQSRATLDVTRRCSLVGMVAERKKLFEL